MQIFTLIRKMNALFVYFLKIQWPYVVVFRVLTISNHEKQCELMVRSLYKIGALVVIKALLNMQIFTFVTE